MNEILAIEAERQERRRRLDERFNVDRAAHYVGVSRSYLNKLRTVGGGPVFIKLGRRVVYAVSDLDGWLTARRRTSTADQGEAA
jgi:predicted DNA-binding transcriptional regulator AlpA